MQKHPRVLEWGALIAGLMLVSFTLKGADREGYLPVVGAAPLRFQATTANGSAELSPRLLLWNVPPTNAIPPATNAPVTEVAQTRNQPGSSETVAVAPIGPFAPSAAPSTNDVVTPFMSEPPPATTTVTDLQAVLKWLLPVSQNMQERAVAFPVFAPATPPPSSKATYQNR